MQSKHDLVPAQGRWTKEWLEIWQLFLCAACFDSATHDQLESTRKNARKPLLIAGAMFSAGLAFFIGKRLFTQDPDLGLFGILMGFFVIIGGLYGAGHAWEYLRATYKLRNPKELDPSKTSTIRTAFEGEAYRLLALRTTARHPHPMTELERIGGPNKAEYDILGVFESRSDLIASLDTEWAKLLKVQ